MSKNEFLLAKALWNNATPEHRKFIEDCRKEHYYTVGMYVTRYNAKIEELSDVLECLRDKHLFGAIYLNMTEEDFDALCLAYDVLEYE